MGMARRKLIDEVSIQELLQMREDGMSNKEIAKNLDVTYATVYALIGKQPAEMTHANRSANGKYYGSRRRKYDAESSETAAPIPTLRLLKNAEIPSAENFMTANSVRNTDNSDTASALSDTDKETVLLVREQTTEVVGLCGEYIISAKDSNVRAKIGGVEFDIKFDEFDAMCREFICIARHLRDINTTIEGWVM